MLVAPVDAEDFLQRVAGRLAAGTVERRHDVGVFDIAHEIHSLCEAILPRGEWEQLACRYRPTMKTAEMLPKLSPPYEGDNYADITHRSSGGALDPTSVGRKYQGQRTLCPLRTARHSTQTSTGGAIEL